MNSTSDVERKLKERLLLARRVEGDRLVLADEVLLAALEARRPLTTGERAAMQASPLTVRRLRQLALELRSQCRASNEPTWAGSRGMLRAADNGVLSWLETDDGCWRLHFERTRDGWQIILQLDAAAPFAPQLARARTLVRVCDGAGALVLQGRLDADGECEAVWPFAESPAAHFQRHGATFTVEPV
jgi:hypothetical protein